MANQQKSTLSLSGCDTMEQVAARQKQLDDWEEAQRESSDIFKRHEHRPREYTIGDLVKRLNHFIEQSDTAANIQVVCHDGMDPSDLAPVTSVELDAEGRLVITA